MNLSHNKDLGLLIMRVLVGVVFVVHGYSKLMMMPEIVGFFGSLGFAPFFAYVVAGVEFLGGISLIIGYGSKVASALLAVITLVAMIKVHGPNGFFVSDKGYEFVLTLFAATAGLFFVGPGKYSVGSNCGCPVKEGNCPATHK